MPESELIPDWSDIPEDDAAEPDDADIEHGASPEEVDALGGEA